MRFFKKLVRPSQNLMLNKLKGVIAYKTQEAFYSFGFVFSIENVLKFKSHLQTDTLNIAKNELLFDINEDNIEVYFVKDLQNNKFAVLIMDYFEPLKREDLFEQISISNYPNTEMEKLQ